MRSTKTLPIIEKAEIIDIANEGKGITKHDDLVIFVEKVVPGDIVDIQLHKKKKNLAEGSPVHFHQYSNKRADSFCSHFGTCGGCKWQNMRYEAQLSFKHKIVLDALTRLAKIELPDFNPILGSENTEHYRNKLEFTFSNKRWLEKSEISSDEVFDMDALGFHVPKRFDKIIDIQKCYLQDEKSNSIRNAVGKFAKENQYSFYDIKQNTGLMRNLILRNTSTQEWMVIVVFAEPDMEKINAMMEFLKQEFSFISSLQYVINQKKNDTIFDQEVICYNGLPYIHEQMTDLNTNTIKFRISAKSFYQTNAKQAEVLYHVAGNFADLKGDEIVYDLYTGTGTIANFVASKAKKVVGIEYVPDAIEDAKVNSQINNISNTTFYAGDMKDLLTDEFTSINGKPDVIITDPPRAGMHEDVCKQLLKLEADKIVYVSCNPSTQARDLAILDEKYKVLKVQPVDMFPHTEHIENVVLLKLR
jgi:23S rRNA (uracil1939-C5)-methyltransferase